MKRGQVPAASSLPPGPEDRGGRGEEEEEEEGGGRASRPVCEVHFQGFLSPLSVRASWTPRAPHALVCLLARSLAAFARITRDASPRAAPPPCRGSAIELNEGGKGGEIISAADGDVTAPAKGGEKEIERNTVEQIRVRVLFLPSDTLAPLLRGAVEIHPADCPLRAASLRSEPG